MAPNEMADLNHFTAEDRRLLTQLEVKFGDIKDDVREILTRLKVLEEGKVSQRDLEQVYGDVDTIRDKINKMRKDTDLLLNWRWFVLGIAAGVGAMLAGIFHIFVK